MYQTYLQLVSTPTGILIAVVMYLFSFIHAYRSRSFLEWSTLPLAAFIAWLFTWFGCDVLTLFEPNINCEKALQEKNGLASLSLFGLAMSVLITGGLLSGGRGYRVGVAFLCVGVMTSFYFVTAALADGAFANPLALYWLWDCFLAIVIPGLLIGFWRTV